MNIKTQSISNDLIYKEYMHYKMLNIMRVKTVLIAYH